MYQIVDGSEPVHGDLATVQELLDFHHVRKLYHSIYSVNTVQTSSMPTI